MTRLAQWDVADSARFAGETIHILGGGASLRHMDISILDLDPVIAVNNAGLDFFPDADILLVMDRRWFEWNRERLHLNRSRFRFGRAEQVPSWSLPWPLVAVEHDKHGVLNQHQSIRALAGATGGEMAINLAYLLGASRIILHGFDMRPGHYHRDHRIDTPAQSYDDTFIPSIERMARRLAGEVEVFNATPGSALTCFPMLEDIDR